MYCFEINVSRIYKDVNLITIKREKKFAYVKKIKMNEDAELVHKNFEEM